VHDRSSQKIFPQKEVGRKSWQKTKQVDSNLAKSFDFCIQLIAFKIDCWLGSDARICEKIYARK